MIQRQGNIWSTFHLPNNVLLVTTNNVLDSQRRLVMGKGIALEAKQKVPQLPSLMSIFVNQDYGLQIFGNIGCLQTKRHWKDPSDLRLIKFSIKKLQRVALDTPHITYNLPRPGCGNGGLNWGDVYPLCETLPDNCVVWSKE